MNTIQTPKPIFRTAIRNDLTPIEAWLRDESKRTSEGFYCNWNIITDSFETDEMFVVDVDGDPVGFLVNEGANHIIAEVRPDRRGQGYGRVIANAMVAQSTRRGLNVIEIACSPESSVPFWSHMGFTPVPHRQAYGGGVYAYRTIFYRRSLGLKNRLPVAVRFYTEEAHYAGGAPFYRLEGDGETDGSFRVHLSERAVCYDPKVLHMSDCYVEIEVNGQKIFRDKTKRPTAAEFGLVRDQGGIPYIETIHLPTEVGVSLQKHP